MKTLEERFWPKVNKNGPMPKDDDRADRCCQAARLLNKSVRVGAEILRVDVVHAGELPLLAVEPAAAEEAV